MLKKTEKVSSVLEDPALVLNLHISLWRGVKLEVQ